MKKPMKMKMKGKPATKVPSGSEDKMIAKVGGGKVTNKGMKRG